MLFRYWTEGLVFISLFLVVVGLPCFGITLLGTKLINELGVHPSKSSILQMSVCWKIIVLMIISFSSMLLFFRYFSD